MPKDDEIDWNGLVTFGSLIGNLIQATKQQQTQDELEKSKRDIEALLHDRVKLIQSLNSFQRAIESFKNKTSNLERINQQLIAQNKSQSDEIENLKLEISSLEQEKGTIQKSLNDEIENLKKQLAEVQK
jgi:predicted RNase H-like nuclease (RuvC/YqgF family)